MMSHRAHNTSRLSPSGQCCLPQGHFVFVALLKERGGEVANRRFSPMFAAFLLELRPRCSCGEGEVSWLSSPSRSVWISVRRDCGAESESKLWKKRTKGLRRRPLSPPPNRRKRGGASGGKSVKSKSRGGGSGGGGWGRDKDPGDG